MKKGFALTLSLLFVLAACGSKEEGEILKSESSKQSTELGQTSSTHKVVPVTAEVVTEMERLQEPHKNTVCEMCYMEVYEKQHVMGMFSTQAIKKDGSVAFYDDIGCLLNAEAANQEENEKFVRDFNTFKWASVEEVTIVKTKLKTPMNWGYAYFIEETDAQDFIAENEGAFIEEYESIKAKVKTKYEQQQKVKSKSQRNEGMHNYQ